MPSVPDYRLYPEASQFDFGWFLAPGRSAIKCRSGFPILVLSLLWLGVGSLRCSAENKSKLTIHRAGLSSTEQQPGDGYGEAVAVQGETIVVGAPLANAAYVYQKPAGGWQNMTQTAILTASDNADHFGASVAVSDDVIVVGAPYTTVDGEVEQGAAYVFVKPAGGWTDMTQTAKLTGLHLDNKGIDLLGNTVSVSKNTIVVGVPNVNQGGASLGWGEALVYAEPPSGWMDSTETAVLYVNPADYPFLGLGFGISTAINGSTIVVGANGCCVDGQSGLGAAFVYVEPTAGWATTDAYNGELTGTEVQPGDFFAESVSVDGSTVLVGSPQTYSFSVGAAYVYVEPSGGWTSMTQTAELYPLFTIEGNFGQSVSISGNNVLIGAPLTTVSHSDQGAGYLFTEPKTGWRSTMKYRARLTNSSQFYSFGQSVSIDAATAVVGFSGTFITNGGAQVIWLAP